MEEKNNILNALNEFAYNLRKSSEKPIREFKLTVPIENYIYIEKEVNSYVRYCAEAPDEKVYDTKGLSLLLNNGIKATITCDEFENSIYRHKLEECFKILSK